jgi:hypothetical protein
MPRAGRRPTMPYIANSENSVDSEDSEDSYIWNPTHLDRIWQKCTYVSEHGMYMFISVHQLMNVHVHGTDMYMNLFNCM